MDAQAEAQLKRQVYRLRFAGWLQWAVIAHLVSMAGERVYTGYAALTGVVALFGGFFFLVERARARNAAPPS